MAKDKLKYVSAIKEMMAAAGWTLPIRTVYDYLKELERRKGDEFDPIRAIDDLAETIALLKKNL